MRSYEFIAEKLGLPTPPVGERTPSKRAYTNKVVVAERLRDELQWQPKYKTVLEGFGAMIDDAKGE